MLPPATQDAIFDAFPSEYDVRVTLGDQTGVKSYDLTKKWAGSEAETTYPIITLQLSPTGVLRAGEQPLSGVISESPSPDPTVAHERLRGRRVYDELIVNVATKGYDDEAHLEDYERIRVLSQTLQQFVRFRLPRILKDGTSDRNVIPVVIPQTGISEATDTSGLVDDEQVSRRTFTVRLNYTLSDVLDIDAVAGLDINYTQTPPGDTQRIEVRYD